MGTGSFPGVKRPGRSVDHPHPSSSEVKEKVELYLYSPSGSSWPVIGWTLSLPFYLYLRKFLLLFWCRAKRIHATTEQMEKFRVHSSVFLVIIYKYNFQGHNLFHYRKHGEWDQPLEGEEPKFLPLSFSDSKINSEQREQCLKNKTYYYVVSLFFASLCYFLIIRLFVIFFFFLYFCFLFCVFVLFCVSFLPFVRSCLFPTSVLVYKSTEHSHRVETKFQ